MPLPLSNAKPGFWYQYAQSNVWLAVSGRCHHQRRWPTPGRQKFLCNWFKRASVVFGPGPVSPTPSKVPQWCKNSLPKPRKLPYNWVLDAALRRAG